MAGLCVSTPFGFCRIYKYKKGGGLVVRVMNGAVWGIFGGCGRFWAFWLYMETVLDLSSLLKYISNVNQKKMELYQKNID
jgi:hypothetical protein